jgi:hypothetical protein
MRDPDLVQRAEQAATALEQAWMRWRARHGLGTGPLPPVSSYVGYSVEEPWGQPRVVLGVEAAEAERLAAILDGHECVVPNGVEPAGLPRPRQPAELDPAPSLTIPDRQLPAGVEPPEPVRPESASLVSPAQSQVAIAPTAAPGKSAGATRRPSESPAEVAARLRELAARVTKLHPPAGARDEPQPEASQSGLVDDSGPLSSQPYAADSPGRTRVLPVSRPSRSRAAGGGDSAAEAWPAEEAKQAAADSTV